MYVVEMMLTCKAKGKAKYFVYLGQWLLFIFVEPTTGVMTKLVRKQPK